MDLKVLLNEKKLLMPQYKH